MFFGRITWDCVALMSRLKNHLELFASSFWAIRLWPGTALPMIF
jgi:hypothetical protein